MMKAVRFDSYGTADVLEVRDVEVPAVGATEVLVRVRAAALNPYDWHLVTGQPKIARVAFGLRRPKIVGVGADFWLAAWDTERDDNCGVTSLVWRRN